jgi:polyhydroxyalkanoate synthesis regulator phasin
MEEEMLDELRRWALFGSGIAELTRSKAESIVKDMVKAGEVKRKQAAGLVKELLEASRENRKELMKLLRSEIQNQIATVGVATKKDFERMERRVKRLEDNLPARSRKKSTKKTTRKKTTAKKTTTGGSSTTQ